MQTFSPSQASPSPSTPPHAPGDAIAGAPTEVEVLADFHARPHAFLDVGHSRLAYRKFGRGPDVVLVHGWPLHSATFRRLVPLLADSFTCHLVDLPGTGQTESKADAPIDLHAHAATMRRAIDVLKLRRYALLAHDSGGFVARHVAADNPRVAALVLGNTEIPGHTPWLVVLYALAAKYGGRGTLRALLRPVWLRRSFLAFGGCFADPSFADGDFLTFFVEPLLASDARADGQLRLVETLDFSAMRELADVHRRIRAPVRLIWGAGDPFFPLAKATRMREQFAGGAELFVIPEAKLFAHEERPQEFAAYARPLLQASLA